MQDSVKHDATAIKPAPEPGEIFKWGDEVVQLMQYLPDGETCRLARHRKKIPKHIRVSYNNIYNNFLELCYIYTNHIHSPDDCSL